MILCLPPAPHTGAFFDGVRKELPELEIEAGTYPGYGSIPVGDVSIEAYATSLMPDIETDIIGFHTGCLVGMEMALQSSKIERLLLIDIPFFGAAAVKKHRAGLDPNNPDHDAFRAAFGYDVGSALSRLTCQVTCVATDSILFDATKRAANLIENVTLIERKDIKKPVFENRTMPALIRGWCA